MQFRNDHDFVLLTEEQLDIKIALDFIILPWTGGTSCFLGTTRNTYGNHKVKTLFYEAYEPMAVKELLKICETIRHKFDIGNICLMHRLGEVPVSQTSVIVAVSAEHRGNAIDAAGYGINEIKARVPIWKKEIFEDDSSIWKENKEVFWQQKQ